MIFIILTTKKSMYVLCTAKCFLYISFFFVKSIRIASLLQKDDVSQYTNRNHESYRYGKGRLAIRRSNNDLLFASILQLTIGSILFLPLISLNATVCALTVRATGEKKKIQKLVYTEHWFFLEILEVLL